MESRVKNECNLSSILRSAILIMRWVYSLKIKILILKLTIITLISIISIITTSYCSIIANRFYFAMDQLTFTNFYWFLSEFSYINSETFFLLIYFWIQIFLFILLWIIITDDPLNFDLTIILLIVSKHTKSKKVNISQRPESNSIPSSLLYEKVYRIINILKSKPFSRLWILCILYYIYYFLFVQNIIFLNNFFCIKLKNLIVNQKMSTITRCARSFLKVLNNFFEFILNTNF
jgi:hypothetical protein